MFIYPVQWQSCPAIADTDGKVVELRAPNAAASFAPGSSRVHTGNKEIVGTNRGQRNGVSL